MTRLTFLCALLCLVMAQAAAQEEGGAGQVYAIIVSGGRNKVLNNERYWNDCAFVYRTLRQTYHLPKSHVTVLMSDGGDPANDMLRADGTGFMSSPTDLDGDGVPDVWLPATRQALGGVLYDLSRQLSTDDHLLFFVTDHGGSDDGEEESFLWLWNEERLYDYSLAAMFSLLDVGSLCVVMGQCYSGGFMDELLRNGRVVLTACRGDEQSWRCTDRDYDEFVYHWTCAVNGADEQGNRVQADADGDGHVTMAEAFQYAQANDRRPETPQYGSWPDELGSRWTLGGLLIRLAIGDAVADEAQPAEVYSVAGTRQASPRRGQVSIVRQGHQVRKIVR